LATALVLLLAGAARAGVYNLEEPAIGPLGDLQQINDLLRSFRNASLALGAEDPRADRKLLKLRDHYLEQAPRLAAKERDGSLTQTDRANLGGVLIRLGRNQEAIRVLQAGNQRDFLTLANLASAYHAAGEIDLAVRYQEQTLEAWPEVFVSWTPLQLAWYRRVERFYLKLLKLRQAEQARSPGRFQWEAVDALFDKVRYVGPSGEFEPGALARRSEDELPPDAGQIVAQLMLWLPQDDRIFWQYGELINASGDPFSANLVFEELVDQRACSDRPTLKAHRTKLMEATNNLNAALKDTPGGLRQVGVEAAWAMTPRAGFASPVVGDAANDIAAATAVQLFAQNLPPPDPEPRGNIGGPAAAARSWLPDWQPLLIGFFAGAIVAFLGSLQWSEWRRRKRAAAAEETPDDAGAVRADAAGDRLERAP
jgi:tetratricopeptide (TPR) repeat protein